VTVILAIVTMTIGNVLALWQDSLRRMLAYSSIAHAGYMLMGVAVGFAAGGFTGAEAAVDGPGAAVFYLAVYSLATLGAFAALVHLGGTTREIDRLDDLAGLGRNLPLAAFCLAVFMFSLAGIPPLAGFIGKLTLFTSTLSVHSLSEATAVHSTFFLTLAIFAAINAAVAAGYYLRVVAAMYFRPLTVHAPAQGGAGARTAMLAAALLVIGVGVFPTQLVDGTSDAVDSARTVQQGQPADGESLDTAQRDGESSP
jgi:NADH-quinone oxidoreductase subunit N